MRELLRVHGNHPIRIKEPFFALEQDCQVRLTVREGIVSASIGEGVSSLLGSHYDDLAHTLSYRPVPSARRGDPRRGPNFFLLHMSARFIAARNEDGLRGGNSL